MVNSTHAPTQVNDYPSVNDLEPVHKALLEAFRDAMAKHNSSYCSLKIDTFIWKMWDYLKEKFSYWTLRIKINDLVDWGFIRKKLNGGKGAKVFFLEKGLEYIKQLTYSLQLYCNSNSPTLLDHSDVIKSDQTDGDLVSKLAEKEGLSQNQIDSVREELKEAPKYTQIRNVRGFIKHLIVKAKEGIAEMANVVKSAEQKAKDAELEATLEKEAKVIVKAQMLTEGLSEPSKDINSYPGEYHEKQGAFLNALHVYESTLHNRTLSLVKELRIKHGLAKVEEKKSYNPRCAEPAKPAKTYYKDWQGEVYG